jgi:hypothetical protein
LRANLAFTTETLESEMMDQKTVKKTVQIHDEVTGTNTDCAVFS